MRSIVLLLVSILIGCEKPVNKHAETPGIQDTSVQKDSSYREKLLASIPKDAQPIMGYRFIIKGDFDGDGKKETITERYISASDGRETNKWYDSTVFFEQLVELILNKEPISFIVSDNTKIDTLYISKGGQVFGLSILKNEGDLNGDGRDEIGYLGDWADWSSMNSYHILSFTKAGWKEIYSFEARDWYAPEMPDIRPGDWGRPIYLNIDTVKTFERVVKKIKNGWIAAKGFEEGGAQLVDTVKLPLVK